MSVRACVRVCKWKHACVHWSDDPGLLNPIQRTSQTIHTNKILIYRTFIARIGRQSGRISDGRCKLDVVDGWHSGDRNGMVKKKTIAHNSIQKKNGYKSAANDSKDFFTVLVSFSEFSDLRFRLSKLCIRMVWIDLNLLFMGPGSWALAINTVHICVYNEMKRKEKKKNKEKKKKTIDWKSWKAFNS